MDRESENREIAEGREKLTETDRHARTGKETGRQTKK